MKLQEDEVTFHRLPPELVAMVASYLDVSSYLALASSSKAILGILISPAQWRGLLEKTRMKEEGFVASGFGISLPTEEQAVVNLKKKVMEEEVKELAGFVKFAKDPKGSLLLALLEHICKRFRADPTSFLSGFMVSVTLSCPSHDIHPVTVFGFALLEQAETMVKGTGSKPQLNLVAYKGFGLEHLGEFASRASRQKQKVAQIQLYEMKNSNIAFGDNLGRQEAVWLKLIKNCKRWKIEILDLSDSKVFKDDSKVFIDNRNGLLEGLAKETSRGGVGVLQINDICIANNQIAHLKKIWKITESRWDVKSPPIPEFSLEKGQWKLARLLGIINHIKKMITTINNI